MGRFLIEFGIGLEMKLSVGVMFSGTDENLTAELCISFLVD